jgi:hypothetical protein
VAVDRYGMFIIIGLLVLISYSSFGDQLARGEMALFRALLPAYQ